MAVGVTSMRPGTRSVEQAVLSVQQRTASAVANFANGIGESFFTAIRISGLRNTQEDRLTFLGQIANLLQEVSRSDDLREFSRDLQTQIEEKRLGEADKKLAAGKSLFADGSFLQKVNYRAYQQGLEKLKDAWPVGTPMRDSLDSLYRRVSTDLRAIESFTSAEATFRHATEEVAASQGHPIHRMIHNPDPRVLHDDRAAAARVPASPAVQPAAVQPPPRPVAPPVTPRNPPAAAVHAEEPREQNESLLYRCFRSIITFFISVFTWCCSSE